MKIDPEVYPNLYRALERVARQERLFDHCESDAERDSLQLWMDASLKTFSLMEQALAGLTVDQLKLLCTGSQSRVLELARTTPQLRATWFHLTLWVLTLQVY